LQQNPRAGNEMKKTVMIRRLPDSLPNCIDSRQPWVKRLKLKAINDAIDNLLVFNKIGDFGAIEIFSDGAIVMLRIDAGWPEKLVRLSDLERLLNWDRIAR